jgi:hypothetical protein
LAARRAEISAGSTFADRSTAVRHGPVVAPNVPSKRRMGVSALEMKSRYSALAPGNEPAGIVV